MLYYSYYVCHLQRKTPSNKVHMPCDYCLINYCHVITVQSIVYGTVWMKELKQLYLYYFVNFFLYPQLGGETITKKQAKGAQCSSKYKIACSYNLKAETSM